MLYYDGRGVAPPKGFYHLSERFIISELILSRNRPKKSVRAIREEEIKVKLSLCLTKHRAMKMYWGVEV
jgi:hypothetical protein